VRTTTAGCLQLLSHLVRRPLLRPLPLSLHREEHGQDRVKVAARGRLVSAEELHRVAELKEITLPGLLLCLRRPLFVMGQQSELFSKLLIVIVRQSDLFLDKCFTGPVRHASEFVPLCSESS